VHYRLSAIQCGTIEQLGSDNNWNAHAVPIVLLVTQKKKAFFYGSHLPSRETLEKLGLNNDLWRSRGGRDFLEGSDQEFRGSMSLPNFFSNSIPVREWFARFLCTTLQRLIG